MSRLSDKAKMVGAAVFGAVVVTSGAATAATGSLSALPLVGSGHHHPHPTTPAQPSAGHDHQSDEVNDSTEDTTDDSTSTETDQEDSNGHGSAVSALAHSLPQGHKGWVICKLASGGKCHAGEHGKAGEDHGKSGLPHGNSGNSGNSGDTTHGKSGESHGKSDLPHGNSGTTPTP